MMVHTHMMVHTQLSIDASKRMTPEDAARLCKIREPLVITFFEQPVRNNDPKLLSQLRRETIIPLAANPKGYRAAYRDLILEDSVDILQPNVKTMGFTEAVLVAGMAEDCFAWSHWHSEPQFKLLQLTRLIQSIKLGAKAS